MDFALQNTINRANGQYFEDLISSALDFYREKGFCCIDKTPEPMKVIRNLKNGRFESVYTKKAQPDYKGVLLGGQAIIFEAKYTDTDQIKQSVVTPVQTDVIEQFQKLGAKCYVMVGMQNMYVYRVPWDVWKGMKDIFGHKYMNAQELKKYAVQYHKGVYRILDGIEIRDFD